VCSLASAGSLGNPNVFDLQHEWIRPFPFLAGVAQKPVFASAVLSPAAAVAAPSLQW